MDRFSWCEKQLFPHEDSLGSRKGVHLYDGDNKTAFDNGIVELTSHRIIWQDVNDNASVISLPLASVILIEDEPGRFGKSAKILLYLTKIDDKPIGPRSHSQFDHIKLAFRDGGQVDFYRLLTEALAKKKWEQSLNVQKRGNAKLRSGILGVQRQFEEKQDKTKTSISVAFEDLNNLMQNAKQMVHVSRSLAQKIRNKEGAISDDETVEFRAYLLDAGVADPVTRDTHSGSSYHTELAKEIAKVMTLRILENGGMMTLTDVYCYMNRARSVLMSPDDLVNACKLMQHLNLPLCIRYFDSGVIVLQSDSHDDKKVAIETKELTDTDGHMTAEQLSRELKIPVILARERLLTSEKLSYLCRDDSVEGLIFYPNLFLTKCN